MLDYGCGDGTFLKKVSDIFPNATGTDIVQDQVEDCRQRIPGHSFIHIDELSGKFDVVMCMEVLEHCPSDIVEMTLTRLSSLIKPDGIVVISVPVEIGLTLVAKQLIRRIAGWRGIGDYKWTESYSAYEFIRMAFATGQTAIPRPLYAGSHPHKGFNWRALEKEIKQFFHIKERRFSPSAILRSQVWFVCEVSNVPASY